MAKTSGGGGRKASAGAGGGATAQPARSPAANREQFASVKVGDQITWKKLRGHDIGLPPGGEYKATVKENSVTPGKYNVIIRDKKGVTHQTVAAGTQAQAFQFVNTFHKNKPGKPGDEYRLWK